LAEKDFRENIGRMKYTTRVPPVRGTEHRPPLVRAFTGGRVLIFGNYFTTGGMPKWKNEHVANGPRAMVTENAISCRPETIFN